MTVSARKTLADDGVLLTAFVLAALILRMHLLVGSDFVIDSDEAIVGLMARHIRAGMGIPIFYYGQPYMGSLEALLAAGSFLLFWGEQFYAPTRTDLLWPSS